MKVKILRKQWTHIILSHGGRRNTWHIAWIKTVGGFLFPLAYSIWHIRQMCAIMNFKVHLWCSGISCTKRFSREAHCSSFFNSKKSGKWARNAIPFSGNLLMASMKWSYHCTGIMGSGNSLRNFLKMFAMHTAGYSIRIVYVCELSSLSSNFCFNSLNCSVSADVAYKLYISKFWFSWALASSAWAHCMT